MSSLNCRDFSSLFLRGIILLEPFLPDPDTPGISFDGGEDGDHDVDEDSDPRCGSEVVQGERGELSRVFVGGSGARCRCGR